MTEILRSETVLDRQIEQLSARILSGESSPELLSEYEKLQVLRRQKLHLPGLGALRTAHRRRSLMKVPA